MQGDNERGYLLYRKAKAVIPGGTQLLSKRPELYAPGVWPPYYEKATGIEVTSVDGQRYLDFSMMGIGACLLGYAAPVVDEAVCRAIRNGVATTLNSPLEVRLAERLVDLHPWADQVRFTRSGGEAMSVATRIARAATGRSVIAVCGYHGWNDWYLAANLGAGDALDGHLLPGLAPHGVPVELRQTVQTFRYNQIGELEAIIEKYGSKLAAITMEPMRYDAPKPGFLEAVRDLARKTRAVLIFDEITSGWRSCLGGVHLGLGVNPDIAVFAKAISNGYPMGAIIGTNAVMEAAQKSFISSTSWTEATGPAAALATIEHLEKTKPWAAIRSLGGKVRQAWSELGAKHGLPLDTRGNGELCNFNFTTGNANAMRTFYTQEMAKLGFLATAGFYPSTEHSEAATDRFIVSMDQVFAELSRIRNDEELEFRLEAGEADVGFRRLV